MTKYYLKDCPNLALELDLCEEHISTLADHACVSTDLFRAFKNGTEYLEAPEVRGLARLWGCNYMYLLSPHLHYMQLKKGGHINKIISLFSAKRHMEELHPEAKDCDRYTEGVYTRALELVRLFESELPQMWVPFAIYRNALKEVEWSISINTRTQPRGLAPSNKKAPAPTKAQGAKKNHFNDTTEVAKCL